VLDEVHVRDGHVVEAAYKEPFDLLFSVPQFEYGDVRRLSLSDAGPRGGGRERVTHTRGHLGGADHVSRRGT
jgi:hypothetical protein